MTSEDATHPEGYLLRTRFVKAAMELGPEEESQALRSGAWVSMSVSRRAFMLVLSGAGELQWVAENDG